MFYKTGYWSLQITLVKNVQKWSLIIISTFHKVYFEFPGKFDIENYTKQPNYNKNMSWQNWFDIIKSDHISDSA